MNKAFVKEVEDDADDAEALAPELDVPRGTRNYLTPGGYSRLKAELKRLVESERPEVTRTVSWAASNGDRSENGDYIYGKRRLREIDRRIRYLMKRLEIAEVVDPRDRSPDQVFFGATVTYAIEDGTEHTVTIVGVDEVDASRGRISWISPVAKALLKAREGDVVTLHTPQGAQRLELIAIAYRLID
jgi:transcription elongation factor GreB